MLCNGMQMLCTCLVENVLQPICRGIGRMCSMFCECFCKCLSKFCEYFCWGLGKFCNGVACFCQEVVVPVASKLSACISVCAGYVYAYVLVPVGQVLSIGLNALAAASRYLASVAAAALAAAWSVAAAVLGALAAAMRAAAAVVRDVF